MPATSLRSEALNIIKALVQGRYRAVCPCCGDSISLAKAALFVAMDFSEAGRRVYEERKQDLIDRSKQLAEFKSKLKTVSERLTRAVNLGCTLERLAPSMDTFPFDGNDCRAIFKPIDYVIFKGLSRCGRVESVVFADVKTGDASLTQRQKQIKGVIECGKVEWTTYRTGVQQ